MILLLYVDDLFVTGKEELFTVEIRILDVEFEMKELGMMHYFLGMEAKCRWNSPWIREVCNGEPEEVQDYGLQGHGHTYGIELEAIE